MGEDTRRDLAEMMAALKVLKGGDASKSDDKYAAGVSKLPGKGEWVKAAPAVAMWCGTLIIVTFMIVFTTLSLTGTPTDSFFRLINLFLNALGAIATLATLAVAMMHARRTLENRKVAIKGQEDAHDAADAAREAAATSQQTARKLNGDLDRRITAAVRAALDASEARLAEQDARSRQQDVRGEVQDVRGKEQDHRTAEGQQ